MSGGARLSNYSFVREALTVGLVVALLGLGIGARSPRAGAATLRVALPNALCEAMISVHPTPPSGTTYAAYHSFATRYLAYYEHLVPKAKQATIRQALAQVIVLMKAEARTTSPLALRAYVTAHQAQWIAGWTVFDRAVIACGGSVIGLLGGL